MLSCFSRGRLFATLWTGACQAPLSMGLSKQEYWNGLPCPPPGDLSDPGINPVSLMSLALADGFFTTRTTWESHGPQGPGKGGFFVCLCMGSHKIMPLWAVHNRPIRSLHSVAEFIYAKTWHTEAVESGSTIKTNCIASLWIKNIKLSDTHLCFI